MNYKDDEENQLDYADERRRKIADFYHSKDLMNKKDLELISANNADFYIKKNRFGVSNENNNNRNNKYNEDNFDGIVNFYLINKLSLIYSELRFYYYSE